MWLQLYTETYLPSSSWAAGAVPLFRASSSSFSFRQTSLDFNFGSSSSRSSFILDRRILDTGRVTWFMIEGPARWIEEPNQRTNLNNRIKRGRNDAKRTFCWEKVLQNKRTQKARNGVLRWSMARKKAQNRPSLFTPSPLSSSVYIMWLAVFVLSKSTSLFRALCFRIQPSTRLFPLSVAFLSVANWKIQQKFLCFLFFLFSSFFLLSFVDPIASFSWFTAFGRPNPVVNHSSWWISVVS